MYITNKKKMERLALRNDSRVLSMSTPICVKSTLIKNTMIIEVYFYIDPTLGR